MTPWDLCIIALTSSTATLAALMIFLRVTDRGRTEEDHSPEPVAERSYRVVISLPCGNLFIKASPLDLDSITSIVRRYEGDWADREEILGHVYRYLAADRIARSLGCQPLWTDSSDGETCV